MRRIDRFLGVPLCALVSVLDRFRRPPVPAPPRRILVILLSEMGSLVLTRPMFQELRRRYPEAQLYALVFSRNREMLELLGLVDADKVLTVDASGLAALARTTLEALVRMRRLRLDAVIDCELFARFSAILAWLSGAPLRAGFHPHTQGGLYRGRCINLGILYNPYRHMTLQFRSLARALDGTGSPLGKDEPPGPDLEPPAPVGASGDEVVQAFLTDFPQARDRKLVLFAPGGGILPIRAWPERHFLELAQAMLADGHVVGILGLAEDRALAIRLQSACGHPRCLDLVGRFPALGDLLALIRHASLLVANDGGTVHLAALAQVPAIILFGPETPVLYGPTSPLAQVLWNPVPCSPCLTAFNHRQSPCDGDNHCLQAIAPARVIALARATL